jgi:uncharacterized protein YjcR
MRNSGERMPAPYLSLADITRIYRVHPATIRRWAREDQWRRTTTRPVRYHLGDAQQSYEDRRAGRIIRHLATRWNAG